MGVNQELHAVWESLSADGQTLAECLEEARARPLVPKPHQGCSSPSWKGFEGGHDCPAPPIPKGLC